MYSARTELQFAPYLELKPKQPKCSSSPASPSNCSGQLDPVTVPADVLGPVRPLASWICVQFERVAADLYCPWSMDCDPEPSQAPYCCGWTCPEVPHISCLVQKTASLTLCQASMTIQPLRWMTNPGCRGVSLSWRDPGRPYCHPA